jgi:hypothetical protein
LKYKTNKKETTIFRLNKIEIKGMAAEFSHSYKKWNLKF